MTTFDASEILAVLDRCCDAFMFPMLDNGYVYPAAARLSLYRSAEDWAMVIEVFGYSPRAGLPQVGVYTFASRLHGRDAPERFPKRSHYDAYLANNPNNELQFFQPIADGDWRDDDNCELLMAGASELVLRGRRVELPAREAYRERGIELSDPERVHVFEMCRHLASRCRAEVLATDSEQRTNLPPGIPRLLQLDEWNHPNVVDDASRPSKSETFHQLAHVLATGDVGLYRPTEPSNTHWRHWPNGGSL